MDCVTNFMDFYFTSRPNALKGNFPVRFDCGLKVKQDSGTQIIMCHSNEASLIVALISQLMSTRYVKVVSVEKFDDEL